jgi:hypothetical protein
VKATTSQSAASLAQVHFSSFVQSVKQGTHVKSSISSATKFLNPCQDGTNASIGSEIMLKSNDTSSVE